VRHLSPVTPPSLSAPYHDERASDEEVGDFACGPASPPTATVVAAPPKAPEEPAAAAALRLRLGARTWPTIRVAPGTARGPAGTRRAPSASWRGVVLVVPLEFRF
jgi:hypothetical protein